MGNLSTGPASRKLYHAHQHISIEANEIEAALLADDEQPVSA